MSFTIGALARHHQRSRFRCGSDALDRYLRRQALQDARRNVSRVFVAVPDALEEIAGCYTLSAGSVERETLTESAMKRLPRYPVPVALLGRLGVHRRWGGQGLGPALLIDALRRVLHASHVLAVCAVVVEAKDERAQALYEHFGFIALPGGSSCPSARSSVSSAAEQPRVLPKPGAGRTCPTGKRRATAPSSTARYFRPRTSTGGVCDVGDTGRRPAKGGVPEGSISLGEMTKRSIDPAFSASRSPAIALQRP